ncbi:hypothetical protein D9756_008670 [Leucocoprinus leucothites]|uniref:Uncharacterized protein n=1 Tax=Leucocoprinus leucothites TaxID=201217 RepID=A0A8H5CYZ0_9AGAR|nr:hypothetical protein D9756_008670 [Leucoagaricus leucothites]
MMRQALTIIRSSARDRVVASSSSSSRLRLVHSSAPSRATVLPALAADEPEEITLAPIFDIFDAPSRLGENSEFIDSVSQTRQRPQKAAPAVKLASPPRRPPPSNLPTPIMFDGPARPRNLPLAFQRRVEQALNSAPASSRQTRRHHTPAVAYNTPDLLIEMFEGPARLSRYSHRPSGQRGKMGNHLFFLGLAGAVGGVTLLGNGDFAMMPSTSKLRR